MAGLWPALEAGLEAAGVSWTAMEEAALGPLPEPWRSSEGGSSGSSALPWGYLECDFAYAAHRTCCAEAHQGAGREDAIGTRFPLVLLFAEPSSQSPLLRQESLGVLASWLGTAPRPFGSRVRVLLVLVGNSRSGAKVQKEQCAALSSGLVRHGVGTVEVRDAQHGAQYVVQCASSVLESRRRRVPSRFKVAGVRCQTLPKDPQDKLRLTWVSQLMQIAGVSEEIAKVIAERHPSPLALMEAVARAGAGSAGSAGGREAAEASRAPVALAAAADSFLADLEYPIRGKKGTRRLGPVVSRRLFTLFHPATPPEHVLV